MLCVVLCCNYEYRAFVTCICGVAQCWWVGSVKIRSLVWTGGRVDEIVKLLELRMSLVFPKLRIRFPFIFIQIFIFIELELFILYNVFYYLQRTMLCVYILVKLITKSCWWTGTVQVSAITISAFITINFTDNLR